MALAGGMKMNAWALRGLRIAEKAGNTQEGGEIQSGRVSMFPQGHTLIKK